MHSDCANASYTHKLIKIRKGTGSNWDALQLEGHPTSRQSFWAGFGQISTAHAQKQLLPSFR